MSHAPQSRKSPGDEEWEKVNSPYALKQFADKYLQSTNPKNKKKKKNSQKSTSTTKEQDEEQENYSKFYKLLSEKYIGLFRNVSEVLELLSSLGKKDEYPPPSSLLSLLPCQKYVQNKHELQQIIEQYPSILHLKSPVNGADDDLLIHRLARTYHNTAGAEMFEYVFMKGIYDNVGGGDGGDGGDGGGGGGDGGESSNGTTDGTRNGVNKDILKDNVGGLTLHNSYGQTPLSLLFAKVSNGWTGSWDWFVKFMVKAARIKLSILHDVCENSEEVGDYCNDQKVSAEEEEEEEKESKEKDGDSSSSSFRVPTLIAALELGASSSVINKILATLMGGGFHKTTPIDFLGRTPLFVAASNKNTSIDVMLSLLRAYPTTVTETDENGDTILTHLIKAGPKRPSVMYKDYLNQDIFYVGSFVQEYPEIMELPEVKTGMLPFMLAAVKKDDHNWSLDVVYSLLRTAPYVMRSFSEVKD